MSEAPNQLERLIEALEEREDRRAAVAALEEAALEGTISLEDLKAELDLRGA